ncbi:MAG: transglycosylase SLT domain-containing protein [Eubacteriales bacterium]|nr:transglycosylase SLT domain-containing protein [Eubacteriales bacterium]MDD3199375.1 transglycosylase SLT domain-containing protein [Eubacteriales bacterium]MDD4121627.1 transglycosylase SLT domain-containing protein [Eubacteriales bacterium]MDD4629207.1 transglycosylase SLT domain-containing protein [Eubacteriales bacterium]
MAKKLISVWLSLTVLIFSSISIYAEENVQGDFFTKNIVINGETIDNNELQYPFILYKDTTYVPLTPEMSEIMGIKAEMDFESRTLKLLKMEPTLINITEQWKKNERKDIQAQVLNEVHVLAYELDQSDIIEPEPNEPADVETDIDHEDQAMQKTLNEDMIQIPQLSVREVDLNEMPILTVDSTLYLPIRALIGENGLGCDVYFDSYTGVYISTKTDIPAESYWMEAESKYNQGLVSYIQKYNGKYTVNKAQELVFMFKNAADTYNIDEKILIAIAHKESTFNSNARGRGGSLGLMQVMPSTGARYGLGEQQLLDAETSINFGAMYLSERIAAYDGNLTKGFSAYNQGSVAVNRGTYSSRYANRVIGTINSIDSYLTSNGYGLGN